jgi:hypothetical protein
MRMVLEKQNGVVLIGLMRFWIRTGVGLHLTRGWRSDRAVNLASPSSRVGAAQGRLHGGLLKEV